MNWNFFSLVGYLSVLLWACVPVLWLMPRWRKRWRWSCSLALVLILLSFVFAKINSQLHVNLIKLDPNTLNTVQQTRQESKLKAAEKDRGADVAQIRYAEDSSGDFLDKAGMEQSERKFIDQQEQASDPEWKKAKKSRSSETTPDNDLDSQLGGKEAVQGMKSETLEQTEGPSPIFMTEAGMAMANRLDGLNLSVIRILIWIGILMVVFDYLKRANVYADALPPLALPSAWLNSMTPIPALVVRPDPPRRNLLKELACLVKRGDSFVYLTDDPQTAAEIPSSLPRIGKKWQQVDVLPVTGKVITDDFVFEALWFGRCCFVVDSADRADRILIRFLELMEERKKVRAHAAQTVHVVWNLNRPPPEPLTLAFERLAKLTGFSLFVCHGPRSTTADEGTSSD